MYGGDGLAYSVAFGKLKNIINYSDDVGCKSASCNMGNVIQVEHILTTGDKWISLHAHLNSFDNTIPFSTDNPIVFNQRIGSIGCAGQNLDTFCTIKDTQKTQRSGNKHDHFELKNETKLETAGISNYRLLWPFGYMTQEEANQLILINDSKKSDDIISGINLVFSDISRFQDFKEHLKKYYCHFFQEINNS